MSRKTENLASALTEKFDYGDVRYSGWTDEVTMEVPAERLREASVALRDEEPFRFRQLIDLCGVDYLAYGDAEWMAEQATDSGFSRGVGRYDPGSDPDQESPRRFAVVIHLLSLEKNFRLRLRAYAPDPEFPVIDSVTDIWAAANWFEREAFDLYGIHFEGHPDLRRILTDYGFVGHPFRKDFPLSGHVEVRYDPERGRVVYQPVSIEPRVLVPKVIRGQSRYPHTAQDAQAEESQDNA
ncbi:MAG TPA: NADH-quinone oxidoreductase subunit C [Gammaproteobacteria bacterium]|nr:NADH-quinone oxidoreductase subunit C [Gammaproteobacteria bacterium]